MTCKEEAKGSSQLLKKGGAMRVREGRKEEYRNRLLVNGRHDNNWEWRKCKREPWRVRRCRKENECTTSNAKR